MPGVSSKIQIFKQRKWPVKPSNCSPELSNAVPYDFLLIHHSSGRGACDASVCTSSSCCHCPTSLELVKDRIFPSLMMLLPFWVTVMCAELCSRLSHRSLDVMLSGVNYFGRAPLSFSVTPCFTIPFKMERKMDAPRCSCRYQVLWSTCAIEGVSYVYNI